MKETTGIPEAHWQQLSAAISTEAATNGVTPPDNTSPIPELESDLMLNQAKFDSSSATTETLAFNRKLQEIETTVPKWYQIGAAQYRHLRENGLTALPGAKLLPSARSLAVPSRDADRVIPCRLLAPQRLDVLPRGVFLHFHGGGWVIGDEKSQDGYLQRIADTCHLACLSVGYRLAPEHPYPAGPDDCEDVALWLLAHGKREIGAPLAFIGGESAGTNLAVVVAARLLGSKQHRKAAASCLRGLLLHYGTFDMRLLPGTRLHRRQPTLVLDEEMMCHFRAAYCPGMTEEQLTAPDVSPFFADLAGLGMPPALFTVGTEDCLLEDSVFMSSRWMLAGCSAVLKVYAGSPHGYIVFDPVQHENAQRALADVKVFVDGLYSLSQSSQGEL